VSAGNDHTCAVLDNDTVKCWGSNTNGKLGLGDTATRGDGAGEMGDALPVVALGTGRSAKAVVAREFHTCALLDNDQIKCWGDNSAGQLGLGDKNNRGASAGTMGDALLSANLGTGRTAKLVTAGIAYTCAILDDDKVKCWGSNSFGQLGLGDLTVRGDNAGEMGDALAYVDLGTGRTATWLSAFNGHTCATLDNGKVKCWGYNGVGNLGLGDTSTRGDAAGEMGDTLGFAEIGTGRSTSYVSCGYGHTCVSLDDGNVKCWGSSGYGQLGLGVQTDRGAGPNQMGDNLPNVKLTGP